MCGHLSSLITLRRKVRRLANGQITVLATTDAVHPGDDISIAPSMKCVAAASSNRDLPLPVQDDPAVAVVWKVKINFIKITVSSPVPATLAWT